ncbi:MAG: hypothetical protein PHI19_00990 [Clostridia bacterium]|nr:hypothetical protein [Clostridia bacterium]
MIKKLRVFFVVFVLIVSTFLVGACEKNSEEEEYIPELLVWQEMPQNSNANLKYFSFYSCDYRENSLQEVLDLNCTNVIFILKTGYAMRDSLEACRQRNMKVMIDWDNGVNVNSSYCPDLIEEYDDIILGFKIDEPWWNNKSLEDFHYYTRTLRETYPDKEVYSCLAVGEFATLPSSLVELMAQGNHPTTNAPPGYYQYCTILAFDFYCAWEYWSDFYLALFEQLKELCTEEQKIWLVPKGFYADKGFNAVIENHDDPVGDELINCLVEHYKLALTEPKVEGMVVFAYRDGTFSDWGISVENFVLEDSEHYREDVKQYYQQIGRAIMHNADYDIVRTDK